MYEDTQNVWMSADWTLPAGSGCRPTGRYRQEAGLVQSEVACPRSALGSEPTGNLQRACCCSDAYMTKLTQAGLQAATRNLSKQMYAFVPAPVSGLGSDWRDVQLPSCPAGKRAGWFNQATIDSGRLDPACTPTEVTRLVTFAGRSARSRVLRTVLIVGGIALVLGVGGPLAFKALKRR